MIWVYQLYWSTILLWHGYKIVDYILYQTNNQRSQMVTVMGIWFGKHSRDFSCSFYGSARPHHCFTPLDIMLIGNQLKPPSRRLFSSQFRTAVHTTENQLLDRATSWVVMEPGDVRPCGGYWWRSWATKSFIHAAGVRIRWFGSCHSQNIFNCLVVWNMNFMTFHIFGMSSSQLTFIFFRGVETTNQI